MPIEFEAQLYFRAVLLRSREVARKKPKIVQNKMSSTKEDVAVQLAKKAWDALTMFYSLGSLQNVI